jgi:aryl-alcohol dehydrogenase-like predicted oxidoreductase
MALIAGRTDREARFLSPEIPMPGTTTATTAPQTGSGDAPSTPLPPIPRRPLGRTGHEVTQFALGGEGVLRTHGRMSEAAAVIHRALDLGVNYCDTAPAYAGSLDYYGAALGERRREVFLASKTHDRTRDGSLRLLDESLKRLRTDHLDLWQLHDLRTPGDLRAIFGRGGALEAMVQARHEGRVRFLGLTGHHDPAILLDAMGRFDFDTVLVALNAADVHRLSFARTVLAEAASRGMGVIGMKVYAAGMLVRAGVQGLSPAQAMSYVLNLPGVSTVVIGCSSPAEVEQNARIARDFQPLDSPAIAAIERHTAPHAASFTSYKRSS